MVRDRNPARIRSASCGPAWRLAKRCIPATTTVRYITTQYGYSDYDALNMSVEKRYSHNFSARGAYSLRLFARHHRRPGGHAATADARRPAPPGIRGARGHRPRAQLHVERTGGNSEDEGRDAQRHAARDDGHAVHDSGRHPGLRSQPHQLRAAAGRHVQPVPGSGDIMS